MNACSKEDTVMDKRRADLLASCFLAKGSQAALAEHGLHTKDKSDGFEQC